MLVWKAWWRKFGGLAVLEVWGAHVWLKVEEAWEQVWTEAVDQVSQALTKKNRYTYLAEY